MVSYLCYKDKSIIKETFQIDNDYLKSHFFRVYKKTNYRRLNIGLIYFALSAKKRIIRIENAPELV